MPVHVHPHIPPYEYLWYAVLDSYDGAEGAGFQPVGYGMTREEALADLYEQMDEHEALVALGRAR